jgi:hypothetical protein
MNFIRMGFEGSDETSGQQQQQRQYLPAPEELETAS